MAYRKEGYRMCGNAGEAFPFFSLLLFTIGKILTFMMSLAVCPPLIAALAGSVLDAARIDIKPHPSGDPSSDHNWTMKGRRIALNLACAALRPNVATLPAGCVVWLEQKQSSVND